MDHVLCNNRIDVIENCEALTNIVVPDTVLRYLSRKNIQAFHGLRNTIETSNSTDESTGRLFYYLYNENFSETYLDEDRDTNA